MNQDITNQLLFCDLGVMEYSHALKVQNDLHALVVQEKLPPVVLLVEHPAVLTLGKSANPKFIKSSAAQLKELGISVERTDRGGQVTAHMLGQLVVYPIIPMRPLKLGVKDYVSLLEDSVISLLADYGVAAKVDAINPGVWVVLNKICAIGIRVKRKVSFHGLALNLDNDLEVFRHIVPCGIGGRGVTNLISELRTLHQDADEAASSFDQSDLKISLVQKLAASLGLSLSEQLSLDQVMQMSADIG